MNKILIILCIGFLLGCNHDPVNRFFDHDHLYHVTTIDTTHTFEWIIFKDVKDKRDLKFETNKFATDIEKPLDSIFIINGPYTLIIEVKQDQSNNRYK